MNNEIKEILDFDFQNQGERIEINEYERDILKDYITNLQEEVKSSNESIIWWQNRFNALQKENERLKKLCDEYEEEHSNEFQCWKRDRKELLDKRIKIDKIDKLINTDYGWVSYYYKYNNRYLKSEIKEDINKILCGDDNE